jgi:hypothetical protein
VVLFVICGVTLAKIRRFLLDGGRQLLVGFGIGSATVLLALLLWPHSGVSGTLSRHVCTPGQGAGGYHCSIQPTKASITAAASSAGHPYNWVPPTWSAKSDDGGHYRLDLAPGGYTLTAQTDDGYQAQATFAVMANSVSHLDLLLERIYQNISGGICLASTDSIATPSGPIPVAQLHVGMMVWTLDAAGQRVAAPVLEANHRPTPTGFHILRLTLADGRVVEASAGHPTAGGRRVGELRAGESLDGSRLIRIESIPYAGDTWDLLPAGPTGTYWANGILLGSTLRLP